MKRLDTLFLAARPDRETADLVERRILEEARVAGGLSQRSRGIDLFHVTLLGLGGYDTIPSSRVANVCGALRGFAHPEFYVTLDRVMRFASADAIVLTGDDVHAARALSIALRNRLMENGLRRLGNVAAKPHMTLLYSDRPFRERKVQPVRWRVGEFFLIHSLVGQSRHIVLEQWPLLVNPADGA